MSGSSSTTSYYERPLTEEEKALIAQQTTYLRSIQPSIDKLVSKGTAAIDNTWTPDWGKLYNNTMTNVNAINNKYEELSQGKIPEPYLNAKNAYYQRAYENALGGQMNKLARRGVVDSSRFNTVNNDLQKNMLSEASKDWNNNINTLAGLYNHQAGLASQGMQLAQQAQSNSFAPMERYLGLAQGQNRSNTEALQAQGSLNNGRTNAVTTTKSGGFGDFLIGAVGAAAPFLCFPEYVLISTNRGKIPIANVKAGDILISKDGIEKVIDIVVSADQPIMSLVTSNHSVDCTPSEVFVTRDGRKATDKLSVGDEILTDSGFEPIIEMTDIIDTSTVYELVVTGQNLFYANGICAEGFEEGEI
ncbi:hypothetical protein HMPREF0872_03745 [Veillonella montpellierensis DNF00314]|uniref:Hint domain-containing protein n=1 Tax=Veillonella montpellierensis DNF00314 TaxID=1401067 RepID=A0A096BXQ8_9FIRM|nr:Hint domain-containing protein [Veillonella montpellierensis]KGF47527.1 hypothetical protein HMPREF0872_03745 [Veillonella montpellierensis DNF00314]